MNVGKLGPRVGLIHLTCLPCVIRFMIELLLFSQITVPSIMVNAMTLRLRSCIFQRHVQKSIELYCPLGMDGASLSTRIPISQRSRRYASSSIGGPTHGQIDRQETDAEDNTQAERKKISSSWSPSLLRMFESAATTFASILVLGLAGYGYHRVCRLWNMTVL